MRHAASRALHAHWDALRGVRAAPGRDEVDPSAIRAVLAWAFEIEVPIVGRPKASDAVFRLCGTRVGAVSGQPPVGSGFGAIWARSGTGPVEEALDAVLSDGLAAVVAVEGAPRGRDAIAFELLLLPLGPGRGCRRPVLGSLATDAAPDWLGLGVAAPLAAVSCRVLRGFERLGRSTRDRAGCSRGPWRCLPERRRSATAFKFSLP